VQIMNLTSVSRWVKRHCRSNQFGRRNCLNPPSFVTLAFRVRLEYRNADRRANSSGNLSVCVEIRPSNPGITRLECVRQASVSTGVSLTAFARCRHCWALRQSVLGFVSLLFVGGVGGRHCWAWPATCWARPHISRLCELAVDLSKFGGFVLFLSGLWRGTRA